MTFALFYDPGRGSRLIASGADGGEGELATAFRAGSVAGGIYAETFALWIVLYMGLSLAASRLPLGQFRLLAMGLRAAQPGSAGLAGLPGRPAPGVPGMDRRPTSAPELLLGIGCYLMGFSLLAVVLCCCH